MITLLRMLRAMFAPGLALLASEYGAVALGPKVDELEKVRDSFETKSRELATLEAADAPDAAAISTLQGELDGLHEAAIKLRDELEVDQKTKRSRDMGDLSDFLGRAKHTIPKGDNLNDDADGRKLLSRLGWDVKNGIVHAPTSWGTTVEMFGEDVLFGDMPQDDPDAAEFFRTTRAAFQPEYRKAYSKMLRNCTKFRSESMAFSILDPAEQKALTEGQDTGGGFLVPPDVQAEMLARTAQRAVIRSMARVVTTSRDKVQWPRVQARSTQGSIFSSGFVGGWVGETPAFSETDPAFGMFDISLKKIRVATKLSNDFISDAASNILAFLAENGAENMALVEDDGFITGVGDALNPLGLLESGITSADIEGSVADTISNNAVEALAETGSAPKITALSFLLPSQYAERASWLMARATEGELRKFNDGNGRPLWPAAAAAGMVQGSPRMFLDSPVKNSEFMPTEGANNKILLYGDFDNYIIAQRAQITTVLLRERFADTDQTGIILFQRVGGALWNEDAFRIGLTT